MQEITSVKMSGGLHSFFYQNKLYKNKLSAFSDQPYFKKTGSYNLKEHVEIWIWSNISGLGVALVFQKLTYKIGTSQAQTKPAGSYKRNHMFLCYILRTHVWFLLRQQKYLMLKFLQNLIL